MNLLTIYNAKQLRSYTILKVRLGMQVVLTNIEKQLLYTVSINFPDFLLHTFNSFKLFLIRSNAHGAHAKSSLLCHIQNIILLFYSHI